MSPICSEMCSTFSSYTEKLRQDAGVSTVSEGTTPKECLYTDPKKCSTDEPPQSPTSSYDGLTPPPEESDLVKEDVTYTPAQLLQLSIRKRRQLDKCKERPLDRTLFLTSTITRLCSEIGRARAERKRARKLEKQQPEQGGATLHHAKKLRVDDSSERADDFLATSDLFL